MKFYYLREFKKENGFNKLTIIERMILSSLLTAKITGDERDLVEIIMNFDGNNDYTPYSKWQNYKDFAEAITEFLKQEKGYISDYVSKNAEAVDEKNNRILHYVGFEYSDLDIHHKNSMGSIACRAFILGCAYHAANDNNDWFEFNINQWSKYAKNQRKRTLEEIDSFMNKHNIEYSVIGNKIKIENKSKRDRRILIENENEIINNITPYKKQEEEYKEIVEAVKAEDDYAGEDFSAPVENIDSILDIGDGHFKWEIFEKLNDFNHNEPYSIETEYAKMKEKFPEITGKALSALLVKYSLDINALVRKNENIFKIYKGEQLGENWKEIKDNARVEFLNIQNIVCKNLSKLYDNNYEIYKYIVLYLITAQKKTLTFKF